MEDLSQMTRSLFFQCTVVALIIAFCAFGQFAIAQNKPHTHMLVIARGNAQNHHSDANPAPNLYAVTQGFYGTPYPNWINNADGFELWPCFANSTTSGSNPGPNLDCDTIGDPAIAFQSGGGAFGTAAYSWPLSNATTDGVTAYGCDGSTNGTQNPYTQGETWNPVAIDGFYIPCGQINTWYEDWTGDSTDEILWNAEVTQGTNVIADTGTQDWGPNAYGALTPPVDVIFYQDFNFGALGQTGKNNGNCVPNNNYPTSLPVSSYPVITAANKTCVDPVAGPATVSVTTEIATPTWTCAKSVCKVKYTKKYEVKQKFTINLLANASSD
jgi:hypothetical protein